MYEQHFGLKIKPFHITPNPDFLYLSTKHREAISCLKFAVMEDVGIILLTGDVGTGKTTLIRYILEGIKNDVEVATIYNTNVSAEQLLASIMEEFELDSRFDNKIRALKTLEAFLRNLRDLNQKPLLIIDDAQNLSFKALEEIRLLSNLQNETGMLLQIILVGQPELDAKLADSKASSLAQRISLSYKLLPFGREDTEKYILHRLKIAGYHKTDLFTPAALDLVYSTTRGIPRAINLLCDNAMTFAFSDGNKIINAPCIKDVLKENRSKALRGGRRYEHKFARTCPEISIPKTVRPRPSDTLPSEYSWQNQITHQTKFLESIVSSNLTELNSLLERERRRYDNLLMKYTILKNNYVILQEAQLEKENSHVKVIKNKKKVRSINTAGQVTQLVE
jgi:general secretion pathway protein A